MVSKVEETEAEAQLEQSPEVEAEGEVDEATETGATQGV